MKHKLFPKILLLTAILSFTSLACLFSSAANLLSSKAGTIANLWSDVPKMDGLSKSNLDLPVEAKVMMQGYFSAASQGQGNLDFIAFTTDQAPSDVVDYYTVDRMSQAGWNANDQIGCSVYDAMVTATPGSNGGALCIFAKDEGNNKGALLAIFAAPDNKTTQTDVFFARVEVSNLQSTSQTTP